MVAAGSLIMATGQLFLAYADSVPAAILARVLVGGGDAMIFGSVLLLIPAWFPPRQIPVLTQVTPLVGQAGQILSAAPLAAALHGPGWTPAFTGLAVISVAGAAAGLLLVRDAPPGTPQTRGRGSLFTVRTDILASLREPGTALGFWTHFTAGFSSLVFSMLWGFPWLTAGEGLERTTASLLISLFVVSGMILGPGVGLLVQRFPLRRSTLTLSIIVLSLVAWGTVLLWPGNAPLPLLALLMPIIAVCGPGSNIGFDFARQFNPRHRLGTATGIVIMGGFIGALLNILLIGLVLDAAAPDGQFTREAFRLALATQFPFFLLGAAMIVRSRARLRAANNFSVPDGVTSAVRRHVRRRTP